MRKFLVTLAMSGSVLLVGMLPSVASAAPEHTDVMFVFDTTGSMEEALEEATEEIEESIAKIRTQVPDVDFGLAEMRDYTEVVNPGQFSYDDGDIGSQPWTLLSPIGTAEHTIREQLSTLTAEGGGDGPEAYGRALYETAQNPSVGWRPGARGVIILVADNVPHDNELNEGIPEEDWYPTPFFDSGVETGSVFDTGVDPGPDNIVGTADDLDFQSTVLPTLVADGKPLEFVDYHGEQAFVPYWQNWTARTGGNALKAEEGESLATKLTELVVAGANAPLPPCPSGQVRDANEHCVTLGASPLPSPPSPPAPPSNSFTVVPRITCAGVCHVVLVQITFDSAGNVVMEEIISGEPTTFSDQVGAVAFKGKAKKKHIALIQPVKQHVNAGKNQIKVGLTKAGMAKLKKQKGKLDLKLKVKFTPDGGTAKSTILDLKVTAPKFKGH